MAETDDMQGGNAGVLDPSGGASQTGTRAYNERLVLSVIRRHGSVSRADIARRTGLSAQTATNIVRQLEQDGMLDRGEPQRGRIGQPSIPMSLNPDGVFSLGLKVGRRSADLILLDFIGRLRASRNLPYRYPTPDGIADFVRTAHAEMLAHVGADKADRIAGLGVALPFELWNWAEEAGAAPEDMEAWRGLDLAALLGSVVPYPVLIQNDATAACAAELAFGQGPRFSDFAYFFVGTFVGGGLVLNHGLYAGRTGNAAAFGSMPITDKDGRPGQLIDHASIFRLEKRLSEHGRDPSSLWLSPDDWSDYGPLLDDWIAETAEALAFASVTVSAVIDAEAIVIDGGFPASIRTRLVDATRLALGRLDLQGIAPPQIEEGMIGAQARAIGAASLPLFSRYHIDTSVLFKELA